ncbi:MAG: antibiotic biosynthesis monooxygenase [Bacteroidales bacterium]|nr:antibiotic biosynthesis monooxygenase [Bacteroidales bacterium]
MIVTCVYVNVKAENIQDFIKAMVENHKGSVEEPGNMRFDVLQNADDPCRFMIYEAFETEEAALLHKNTPHYLKWRDTVQEFMADTRYGVRYNVIEPSGRGRW